MKINLKKKNDVGRGEKKKRKEKKERIKQDGKNPE